jgi:hypothetical protein
MDRSKFSGADVEVIPLEFWQIEKIQQKQFTFDRIFGVRDTFNVLCFTGFAYHDIYDLTRRTSFCWGERNQVGGELFRPITPSIKARTSPFNCAVPGF